MLNEGELIKLKSKWYKAEKCRLNRAYPVACGSKFYYQLRELACSFLDSTMDSPMHVQRQTKESEMNLLDSSNQHACCESACTMVEFFQYCPTKQ